MERYFEEGTLNQEELEAGLRAATRNRQVFPLVCTSAQANMGIGPLLDSILAYLPPAGPTIPLAATGPRDRRAADLRRGRPGPAGGFRLEDHRRPVRRTHHHVPGRRRHAEVRFDRAQRDPGRRRAPRGTDGHAGQDPAPGAGTAGRRPRRGRQAQGDAHQRHAGREGQLRALRSDSVRRPVLSYAIEPKSRGDEEKISGALQRLREEDPTIQYTRDPQTRQLLLSGQGQLHIEVTVAKLKRRFGVEVNLKLPRIPYRETIMAATEAHGRHKKQSGGHGQFGDCKIRVEPLARGEDFAFVDEIFGGSIPRQFIPAVEKGIQEARQKGYLAGYPMVDFKGHPARRAVPLGRLERDVVQDGRAPRLPPTRWNAPDRRCWNRS